MGEPLSLSEAAERASVSAGTMRMHVLRGKLKSSKPKGRLVIDSDDLDAYMLSGDLRDAIAGSEGKSSAEIYRSLNKALSPLPQDIKDAILQGMPRTGKGGTNTGSPEPWQKAIKRRERAAAKA